MNGLEWWEEQPRLWSRLVPKSGQAPTVQGELIRCTGKLTDEAYRNGNCNWESGYESLTRFIAETLDDADTFTDDQREKIRSSAKSIIDNFKSPDLSGHGGPYYFLTEMAVRWCLAHPKAIPRTKNPKLLV